MRRVVGYYDSVKIVVDYSYTRIKMGAYHTLRRPSSAIINVVSNGMGLIVNIGDDFIEIDYPNIENSNSEIFFHRLKRLYMFLVWSFDSENMKYTFEDVFPPIEWAFDRER